MERVVRGVVRRDVQHSPRRGSTMTYCVALSVAIIACGNGKEPATHAIADGAAVIAPGADMGPEAAQPVAACDTTSFTSFWRDFRAAEQRGGSTAVQEFVADTFAVRGPLDSDAWVRVSKHEFARRWSALLEQDPGLRVEPETLREYMARTDTLPAQTVDPAQTTARVADLVFQCADGRWRLSRAYTSE